MDTDLILEEGMTYEFTVQAWRVDSKTSPHSEVVKHQVPISVMLSESDEGEALDQVSTVMVPT